MESVQAQPALLLSPPRRWMAIVVGIVAALPYLRTLAYPFVYDDGSIIVANTALHTPAGLIKAWALPYWPPAVSGPAGLYRPVAQFIYALLWNIGGGRPLAFHVWAVGVHIAAALAVFALLAFALAPRVALLGALLFAVHPVHVEAVASIVGSADALATLLALGFVLILLGARDRGAAGEPLGWRTAVILGGVYALAIGAKESAAATPALGLAALWAWRPAADGTPRRMADELRRGWRVWLACAAALAVMTIARGAVLGEFSPPAGVIADGIAGVSTATRFWTMTSAWPTVAALLFWPAHLMMHYGPSVIPTQHAPTLRAGASLGLLILCGLAAGVQRAERRPAAALAFILLGYLPASNLLVPTGQLLAERTLYLPSVGAVMFLAWMLGAFTEHLARRGIRRAPMVATAAVALLTVVGLVRTTGDAGVWRTEETLFTSGIAADPRAFHPRIQLARWYGRHGQEALALAEMDTAFRLAPNKEDLAFEYATHLLADHRAATALPMLAQASAANDTSTRLRLTYLTTLLTVRGPRAVVDEVTAHTGAGTVAGGPLRFVVLGNAYEKLGLADSAVAAYAAGVEQAPRNASMRAVFARALDAAGRTDEARAQRDTAARLGHDGG